MDVISSVLFASTLEIEHQQTFSEWFYGCLGFFYSVTLFGSGVAVLAGGLLVVFKYRKPAIIAAYAIFLPLPALIGFFGTFHGIIHSFTVMSTSSGRIHSEMVYEGFVAACVTSFVGLLVLFPAYLVVSFGLLARTIQWYREEKTPVS